MTQFNRRAVLAASAAFGFLPALARAQSVAPAIEIYAASPWVDQIALSPNGKRAAFITQDGDIKMLIHVDLPDGELQQINLGPFKIRNLMWSDNDHVVVLTSQTTSLYHFAGRKQEAQQARVINLRTREVRTLFDNQEQFYAMVIGDLRRVKIDGTYYLTASNYRIDNVFNLCLFRFDADGRNPRLLCEGTNGTEGFMITPDGYLVAYSDFDDDRKEWTLRFNQAPRGKPGSFRKVYSTHEALNYPSVEGLGRDGASVVLYVNTGETSGAYHEMSPDGTLGPAIAIRDDAHSSSPLFHPVTGRLAGFSHRSDQVTYDYDDPLLKKITLALPQIMGDDYRTTIVEFGEEPRQMILYGEDAKDAGSYYFADLKTGAVVLISHNYEDLPAEWITEKAAISYVAADGLNIPAYLTLPPRREAKHLPLIVLPHGGPQVRDTISFDWQAQVLASRGYAVLQPNFRGSGGFGRSFVNAGHGEFGRKMQTDLSDGVRHLVKQGLVDPKRVAILGASYGGYAALAGATLDPGVYRCAVSIAGLADPRSFVSYVAERTGGQGSSAVMYWQQFLGDSDGYDAISPVKQAAKASCPILLIHGNDDVVVPIDQSRRMESALKKAGKPVEFITYKGQDHWETVGSARIEMMKAAIAFLNTYNPA